jgi:hypothetical protein
MLRRFRVEPRETIKTRDRDHVSRTKRAQQALELGAVSGARCDLFLKDSVAGRELRQLYVRR